MPRSRLKHKVTRSGCCTLLAGSFKWKRILTSLLRILSSFCTYCCVVCHVRCSILACSSYVALGLGDNVMALAHAQKLLSQSNLVGALK